MAQCWDVVMPGTVPIGAPALPCATMVAYTFTT